MSQTSAIITAAQTVAIVSTGFVSGLIFALSHIAVPALYHAPTTVMLKQFATIYAIGKATAPTTLVAAATFSGYLAYALPSLRYSYVATAVLPCMVVPWTGIMMMSINDELARRLVAAENLKGSETTSEAAMPKGQKTVDLLAKWQGLNYVRALFPLAGAIVGVWTAVS
ncbi:hypothetical protein MMC32_008112 [Xylographa parallela]|nr:hypothetical protein [Xylographa parallela]